jgi:hypothetical protein
MSFKSNKHTLPLNDFYTLYNDYINQYNIYTIFKFFFSHFDDYFSFIFKFKIYCIILFKLLCKLCKPKNENIKTEWEFGFDDYNYIPPNSDIKIADMIIDMIKAYSRKDKDLIRTNFINQHIRIINFIMKFNYPKFNDIGSIYEIEVNDSLKKNNYLRSKTVIADCLYYQTQKYNHDKNDDFFKILSDNVSYTYKNNTKCSCDETLRKKYIEMNIDNTKIPEHYFQSFGFHYLFTRKDSPYLTESHAFTYNKTYEEHLYKEPYDIYKDFLELLKPGISHEILNELQYKLQQYQGTPCLNYFMYEISETILKYINILNTFELCVHNYHLKNTFIRQTFTDKIKAIWLYQNIKTVEKGMDIILKKQSIFISLVNVATSDTLFDLENRRCRNTYLQNELINMFNLQCKSKN